MKSFKTIKKLPLLIAAALLAATFLFSGCTPSDVGGGDDPIRKPSVTVEQDLSMFDNVLHYGIEQVTLYTLTITGGNASFANGEKTMNLAEKAVIPEIVPPEGEYVVGIKNVKTGKITTDYRFRMPAENTEIEILTSKDKPTYFKELTLGTYIDYNSAADNSNVNWQQVESAFESNGPFTMNFEYSITRDKTGVDVSGNGDDDYLRGCIYKLSGVAGNAARIVTYTGEEGSEEGITAGQSYTFTYNFQNFGENTVSFRAYQVQTGIRLSATSDRPKASAVNAGRTITLAPNESASYQIAFTAGANNANIIPVFELRSTFDDEKLGVAIAKENKPLDCAHDIELVEATEGDCGKAGNTAYYGCSKCGGMWSDEGGENEVSVPDVTVKKQHTCDDLYAYVDLYTHRRRCSVCGGVVTDAEKHVLTYRVLKEPTESELGVKEEACDCGFKTGNTLQYREMYSLTVESGGGSRKFDVKVDTPLPDGAKELLGDKFYNADNLTETFDKETFIMPEKDITVKNYDTVKGSLLTPAEATTGGGYHSSYDGGTADLVYKKDSAVKTQDDKVVLGREISMKMNGETATVRIDSQYNPENSAISVNRRIYDVTVENRNETAVKFDITQVNSGVWSITGVQKYNDVTLEPGSSRTFEFVFPDGVGTNANALTVLWFKEMTANRNVVLGVAVSHREYDIMHTLTYKADDGTSKMFEVMGGKTLTDEIKTQLPESFYIESAPSVIYTPDTFQMPFGDATVVAVKNQKLTFGVKTYEIKAGDGLPDDAKSLLADEFYNVNDRSEIFSRDTFVMPAKDLTVANLDKHIGNPLLEYDTTWWVNGGSEQTSRGEYAVKKEDGGMLRGRKHVFKGGAGWSARIASPYGSNPKLAGATFRITVENLGSQSVTFGIAQINGGSTRLEGCYEDNITLAPGQSKEFTFTFPTNDPNMSNGNALTLFTFAADAPSEIILGMALSYQTANA